MIVLRVSMQEDIVEHTNAKCCMFTLTNFSRLMHDGPGEVHLEGCSDLFVL